VTASADDEAPTFDPGRKGMHRLNTVEYNATVQDVLGTPLAPANANWRGGEFAGFDNIASVLGVDAAQYGRYFDAAQTLAAEVFASDELRTRFVSCDASEVECVRTSIGSAGLRLFRRPLTEDEVTTYERVYDASLELGDEPLTALELAFRALLSSAEFLYRIEFDPDPGSTSPHPLDDFELASRLSYFLWSSAPDDALLQYAADGVLHDPAALSAVVDEMLEDSRSERFISNFAGQWLGARQVISHPVASGLYWPPELALAASDELVSYFSEFVRDERSWFEFPEADVNYVDGWLAIHYGMPTPPDSHTRVVFEEDERAGFFGLAGFLALTSFDRRTSPSLRGRWIAGNLLCIEVPEPPPEVPKLDESGEAMSGLNVREALEQHRQSPACASCHAVFDAYGLALEEYDAIGQYRSTYADTTAVDATGVLPPSEAHPTGQQITGLAGLARAVAADARFGECLAQKLFTYGLGRSVTPSDAAFLEQAQRDWLASGEVPSVRRLIRILTSTEPFRFRRGGDALEKL
jgi:hypothetical protein